MDYVIYRSIIIRLLLNFLLFKLMLQFIIISYASSAGSYDIMYEMSSYIVACYRSDNDSMTRNSAVSHGKLCKSALQHNLRYYIAFS